MVCRRQQPYLIMTEPYLIMHVAMNRVDSVVHYLQMSVHAISLRKKCVE